MCAVERATTASGAMAGAMVQDAIFSSVRRGRDGGKGIRSVFGLSWTRL